MRSFKREEKFLNVRNVVKTETLQQQFLVCFLISTPREESVAALATKIEKEKNLSLHQVIEIPKQGWRDGCS